MSNMKNNLITILNFIGIILLLLVIIVFIPLYTQLNIVLPDVIKTCNKIEINKPLNKNLLKDFQFYFNEEEPIHNNQYMQLSYLLVPSCNLEIKNNIVISKQLLLI